MFAVVLLALAVTHCWGGSPDEKNDIQSSPQQLPGDLQFGDMALTAKQMQHLEKGQDVSPAKNTFAASNNPYHRWPNAVIPYEFDCSLEFMPSAHEAVRQAMAEWESKTCIRFVKRTNEKDYLHFFRDTHCWGNVGRIGGASRISIGYGCDYRHVMVHEIGHVVGFWHEQNRKDRDQYVKIHWENIDEWVKSAFRLVKESDSLGVPYDYGSIMHYPWTAFSKNGKITMEPLKKVTIQPYVHLSDPDAKQTSLMYNCAAIMRKRRAAAKADLPGRISATSDTCEDKSKHCAAWKKNGGCVSSSSVFENCQKTCESVSCGYTKGGKCVDKYDDCPVWADAGHCYKNPTVANYCVKSCSPDCIGTNPATSAPATNVPTRPPVPTQGRTEEPYTGPLPTTSTKTVRLGTGKLCLDARTECAEWAERGECERNPGWMLKNCLKSCNVKDGCDATVLKPPGACANPLGLAFDGSGYKIPDSAMTATSHLAPGGNWKASGENARLYFRDDYNQKRIGAWCVQSWEKFPGAYLQVDLQQKRTVNYIATQGRDKYFERVSKFKIGYSNDGTNFQMYKEDGEDKVFNGNCDHFTPILNHFKNSISARYLRYYPTEANFPCVRMEFYGC